jgi:hypothetical protein
MFLSSWGWWTFRLHRFPDELKEDETNEASLRGFFWAQKGSAKPSASRKWERKKR